MRNSIFGKLAIGGSALAGPLTALQGGWVVALGKLCGFKITQRLLFHNVYGF